MYCQSENEVSFKEKKLTETLDAPEKHNQNHAEIRTPKEM